MAVRGLGSNGRMVSKVSLLMPIVQLIEHALEPSQVASSDVRMPFVMDKDFALKPSLMVDYRLVWIHTLKSRWDVLSLAGNTLVPDSP